MQYENIFYKTSDHLLDIEFLFVDLGEEKGWRAYILTNINYKMFSKSRSDEYNDVHRLCEEDKHIEALIWRFMFMTRSKDCSDFDISYICWTKVISSLENMKKVAAMWSEITAFYIRNGGSFQDIQPILNKLGIISM